MSGYPAGDGAPHWGVGATPAAAVTLSAVVVQAAAPAAPGLSLRIPPGQSVALRSQSDTTAVQSGIYGWAGSPLPCVRDPATGQWHVKLS